MGKYKGLYKCLLCGRTLPLPDREPKELPDEKVGSVVAYLADSTKQHYKAREHWPYSVTHDCWGNGKNIGAAIFAGVVRVDEKGEDDGSVPRE